MKTVTVRDLRLHWPKIEKSLARTSEPIIVTRDGQPVAQFMRLAPAPKPRPRFNPQTHTAWLRQLWGKETPPISAEQVIARERTDRKF